MTTHAVLTLHSQTEVLLGLSCSADGLAAVVTKVPQLSAHDDHGVPVVLNLQVRCPIGGHGLPLAVPRDLWLWGAFRRAGQLHRIVQSDQDVLPLLGSVDGRGN